MPTTPNLGLYKPSRAETNWDTQVNNNWDILDTAVGSSAPVQSVNGHTGAVVLTTGDVAEGSRLYFTNGRVDAEIDAHLGTKNAANGIAGLDASGKLTIISSSSAPAHKFATGIAADGSLTYSQPTYSDLSGIPPAAGATTQLQFNDAGVFAGADLTWDKTNKILNFPTLGTGAVTGSVATGQFATATATSATVTISAGDFVVVDCGWSAGGRADALDNGTALVLTEVQQGANGSAIYLGTITGGGSNAFAGATVTIAGFVNTVNNGAFYCLASTATSLTLQNIYCLNEVHAGTAANTYIRMATNTAQFGMSICPKAIVPATSVTVNNGGSNPTVAVATFTGVGGIAQFRQVLPTYTATNGATDTITSTVANSMLLSFFTWTKTGGTSDASSNSGTMQSHVINVSSANHGAAIVTQAAATPGSFTNSVTLSATVTTGYGFSMELIPAGTVFGSDTLTLQNSYFDGTAVKTDTWKLQAALDSSFLEYPFVNTVGVANTAFAENAQGTAGLGIPPIGYIPRNSLNLTFTGEGCAQFNTPNLVVNGSILIQQLANPSAPTVTPTGADNSKTYGYRIQAFDAFGNWTAAGAQATTTHGPTALSRSAGNYITVSWMAVPGAAFYKVWRSTSTGTPSTTNHVATVYAGQTLSVIDDGSSNGASTADIASPINTTGSLLVDGTIKVPEGTATASMSTAGIQLLPDVALSGNSAGLIVNSVSGNGNGGVLYLYKNGVSNLTLGGFGGGQGACGWVVGSSNRALAYIGNTTTGNYANVFGNANSFTATSGDVVGFLVGGSVSMGVGTSNNTFAPTSGTATFESFKNMYVVNQTGGANGAVTGLMINATETAVGGTHNLLDLQAGAAGTTSQFAVTNTGKIKITTTNTATTATTGANGATPAQVAGYLIVNIGGTDVKIPYFNT